MLRLKVWPTGLIRHGSLILGSSLRAPAIHEGRPFPTSSIPNATFPRYFSEGTAGSGFQSFGDTIYALSTAQGKAGIAIIRVSGPSCVDVSYILFENEA